MKVRLAFDSKTSLPFSEQSIKFEEMRDGEYIVDISAVAFAEETDDETVILRIHGGGEYTVSNARIRATYDM